MGKKLIKSSICPRAKEARAERRVRKYSGGGYIDLSTMHLQV
jgi:hypothetical protein